jgi:superfamily II DNA helicase RecQ
MSLHCFFIAARQPEPAQSEVNRFLASHRVVAVRKEWLADGAESGWALCVEVLPGPGPLSPGLKDGGRPRSGDVDYKQVLSPTDFALYSRLRELRKRLAEEAGVPVYAVFSNEQLASVVTQRVNDLPGLKALEGIGAGRAERFGPPVLDLLRQARAAAEVAEVGSETLA